MEDLKARPEITSLIESVSLEHGIKNHIITDVKTNQKGEGYLGQIFMVTVKDAKTNQHLEFIIKAAFIENKVREMVPIRMSFQNEIYFYNNVYPVYGTFEKERRITRSSELVPKCLKVCVEEKQEMLALENLKSVGFEVFDKTCELDSDHVKLICKAYGKIHAYSYALRDQEPEKYEKIVSAMHNVFSEFNKNEMFSMCVEEVSKTVMNALIPGEDDEVIKKYEKYSGKNSMNIFKTISEAESDCPAILHGDCWSNNMLFKYEETKDGRKPTDMRLIDFQLIKIGSPVCDLSYCLYSGASKEVFDNLNDYLKIYHDIFSSFLRELGSDPETLFPFSKLQQHWKKYAKWGMIMAFQILRMKLTYKEDMIDFTDDIEIDNMVETFNKMKFNEEGYSKRIRGLLWHMHELDAL